MIPLLRAFLFGFVAVLRPSESRLADSGNPAHVDPRESHRVLCAEWGGCRLASFLRNFQLRLGFRPARLLAARFLLQTGAVWHGASPYRCPRHVPAVQRYLRVVLLQVQARPASPGRGKASAFAQQQ